VTTWPKEPAKDWHAIDRKLSLPNDREVARIAERWNSQKAASQHRPEIVADHRLVGLFGERAFARYFRLPMDLMERRTGSRRSNFTLSNGWVVDVVTRRPIHGHAQPELAVPADTRGKVDVWVLVTWLGTESEPIFTGWITETAAVASGRLVQFHDRGVVNRVVEPFLLAPIEALLYHHKPNAEGANMKGVGRDWWKKRAEEREELIDLALADAKTVSTKKKKPEPPEAVQPKLL
jgi:hypothetical protein